ncbi:hypothetical protein AABD40_02185 [Staphylococcus shinii]|nr:hypothetical protein [Staphylococcus shinii]MDW8569749.1 hypothetical protein [Staphylococcus shinii]MDW8571671.1 hypothetical protein [Staphylococcus shinii]
MKIIELLNSLTSGDKFLPLEVLNIFKQPPTKCPWTLLLPIIAS